MLRARKTVDLFRKYGVLGPAEMASRHAITVEKYVKQILIEAETMVSIARSQVLPAALRYQAIVANAVASHQGGRARCGGYGARRCGSSW